MANLVNAKSPFATAQDQILKYTPAGPTIKLFHDSKAFFRGIMGPIGSSKSTACVMEILSRSMEQKPSPNGQRRTRWAVVRNSYPELKTTTLKTWNQWVPAHFGRLTMDSPIRHMVETADLEMEVLFLALDRPEDVKKMLSLELTGAWFNEAREIPKAIVDGMTGRVGRWPPLAQGGPTWSGIIADTNPPDDQGWWYKYAEEATPEDWEFFSQPSGRSPDAENLQNLIPNYYKRLIPGKDPAWVQVYVDGEYGYLIEGKPVYAQQFRDKTHVPEEAIEPSQDLPLMIGADFGLTPAAIIGQRTPAGRWDIIDEFCTDDCGVTKFGQLLAAYVALHYPDFHVAGAWCDPAGGAKIDEHTALELMNLNTPWKWRLGPTNLLGIRLEAVRGVLNRLVDGMPGLRCSRKCKTLRKGFSSGYHYKTIGTGDGSQVHQEPNKNKYSHPHDALQYLLTGGGEHNVMMGRENKRKDRGQARLAEGADYNPLNGIPNPEKKRTEPPYMKKLREKNGG